MADGWRLVPGGRLVPDAAPGRAPGGEDPALSRAQRVRRLVRDIIVDRLWLGPRVVRTPGRAWVLADTVDGLRAADSPGETTRLTVVVVWWVAPWRGWSGRIGTAPGLRRYRVALPARGRGRAVVDLRFARPVAVRVALDAAAHALRPVQPLPVLQAAPRPAITIDAGRINPRGRRPESYRDDAPVFVLGGPGDRDQGPGGRDHGPGGTSSRGPWGWPGAGRWRSIEDDLSRETVMALRCVGSVHCGEMGEDPVRAATVVASLAATGVLVHAPDLAPAARDLLGKELRDIVAEPLPPTGALDREVRSVRQRRAALREHGAPWEPPAVSAILATRRAEMLPAILGAIAGQTYPNLEIVLCLHGIDGPDPVGLGRPVEVVRVDADVPFGEALGRATARASGTLVTKFDDDDTYGAEHIWDLVLARHYSGATMVGKGTEFVYLEGADITVRRRSGQPEAEDTIVAGGTMLISRGELEELGGWRPVPRSVDRGLLDRLIRAGATIYRTHPLGYLYHRRAQGHTWAAEDEFFLRTARQQWDGLYAP